MPMHIAIEFYDSVLCRRTTFLVFTSNSYSMNLIIPRSRKHAEEIGNFRYCCCQQDTVPP